MPLEWRISAGPVAYPDALAAMEERVAAIRAGEAPELVWLLEHPPLYTAGTSARVRRPARPRRASRCSRPAAAASTPTTARASASPTSCSTCSGAGRDLRRYIWQLEEWVIRTLGAVQRARRAARGPHRHLGGRAAAAREAKIAAIGVRVRRWVTYHGVAINLDPDLEHFAASCRAASAASA